LTKPQVSIDPTGKERTILCRNRRSADELMDELAFRFGMAQVVRAMKEHLSDSARAYASNDEAHALAVDWTLDLECIRMLESCQAGSVSEEEAMTWMLNLPYELYANNLTKLWALSGIDDGSLLRHVDNALAARSGDELKWLDRLIDYENRLRDMSHRAEAIALLESIASKVTALAAAQVINDSWREDALASVEFWKSRYQ